MKSHWPLSTGENTKCIACQLPIWVAIHDEPWGEVAYDHLEAWCNLDRSKPNYSEGCGCPTGSGNGNVMVLSGSLPLPDDTQNVTSSHLYAPPVETDPPDSGSGVSDE